MLRVLAPPDLSPELQDLGSMEIEPDQTLVIGRKAVGQERSLILPRATVSALHAEIRGTDEGWVLIDLESTNGTRLNGKAIIPTRHYKLRSRDEIEIADCILKIEIPAEEIDVSEDELRQCHYSVRPVSKH